MQDRTMTNFIAILLIVLPFGVWGATVHHGQAHTILIAYVVALGLMLPNAYMRIFMAYLAGWLSYVTAGLFLGFMAANASITTVLIDGSVWPIIGMSIFLIIYGADKKHHEIIYNAICITALIQAIIGLSQVSGYDPIVWALSQIVTIKSDLQPSTAVGTLGNNNFLAAFVAASLPFFFRRGWCMAIPIIIACLFVCKTTTAFIAAIAGTVFYFWPQIRENLKWSVPSCLVAGIIGLYYAFIYHPITANDRPDLWLDGIQKVTRSWRTILIGFGPNAEWRHGDKLHSEYFMMFYNFGVIGLGLMAGYIASIFKSINNVDRILMAAFVIICVDAIGNHLLHITTTALLVITITALIEKQRRESR